MAERHDLHVRAHTVQLIGKERGASQNTNIRFRSHFRLRIAP
jgi:hypothetical protein